MKPLRVIVRVKNNHLLERREELGLSCAVIAKACGISSQTYGGYELLRRPPKTVKGNWTDSALAIARFYDTTPDELWPTVVQEVRDPVVERKIEEHEALALAGIAEPPLLPDAQIERGDLASALDAALYKLKPDVRRAVVMHYVEGKTLEEIGRKVWKKPKSRERVRQIINAATLKMSYNRQLRSLVGE